MICHHFVWVPPLATWGHRWHDQRPLLVYVRRGALCLLAYFRMERKIHKNSPFVEVLPGYINQVINRPLLFCVSFFFFCKFFPGHSAAGRMANLWPSAQSLWSGGLHRRRGICGKFWPRDLPRGADDGAMMEQKWDFPREKDWQILYIYLISIANLPDFYGLI